MFKLGTNNSHDKTNFVENLYHVRHPISGIIPILSRFFFPEFFLNGKNFQVTQVFVKKTEDMLKNMLYLTETENRIKNFVL